MNTQAIIDLIRSFIHGDEYQELEGAIAERLNGPYRAFLWTIIIVALMIMCGIFARMYHFKGINIVFGFLTIVLGFLTFSYHRYLLRFLLASSLAAIVPPVNFKATVTEWCKTYIMMVRYILGASSAIFFFLGILPTGGSELSFLGALLGIACLILLPKPAAKK